MKTNSLLGLGRFMIPVPAIIGQRTLLGKARKERARLASIRSEAHHLVHDFVTREIPGVGEPISPEFIGQQLNMPVDRVNVILDELEKKLILYREGQEAVVWSYPVTAARTPHHLTFSTGEQGYAAWAIDAVATPFVQGRLRTAFDKNSQPLSIVVKTECVHCGQSLHVEIDSEMRCRVEEAGADPWVFIADVDFSKLAEPSIVDVFWRESVFFWSEEHAREHRRQVGGVRGIYMTLERTAYVNSIMQDAIFAFSERDWGVRIWETEKIVRKVTGLTQIRCARSVEINQ